jgi:iron complex outermembrane receptor protein
VGFRDNVRADETEQEFLQASPSSQVNLSAEEQSVALFATGAFNLPNHTFQFGLRHNWFQQTAAGQLQRNENTTTGFVGWEWFVNDNWSVSAETASAFRIPSLTERFFSGTTARGTTIGNSNLREEEAPGTDLGAHWKRGASYFNAHVFQQSFRDYIERTIIDPQTRGHSNLNEGNIYGLEIDGEIGLPDNFAASFNAHLIEGEDENGNTIADIPAAEFGIGLNYRAARGQARLYWRHRFNNTEVARTEQAVDSANVVDLDYRYTLSERSAITFYLRNALNDSYVISSDEISTLGLKSTINFL